MSNEQTIKEATKLLSDVLENPFDALYMLKRSLTKFNRWQIFRIKFYMFIKNTKSAQKYILDKIK